MMPSVKSDHDWESECDARTLAESEVIKKDASRLERAQNAAARLAEEAKEKANAMAKVADPKDWYKAISRDSKES
jgi:hypothetical protein